MAKQTYTGQGVANKNNKLPIIVIVIAMAVALTGTLAFFSKVIQTETYWVLGQSVPQRSQVTPDMLVEVEVNKGGAPLTVENGGITLTDVEVSTGNVFTRIPLQAGDLVTTSNTTSGLSDIRVGLPDDWTVTSFSVPADNAAGGRITRGTYFDMMVYDSDSGKAFFPFVNLLALDTSVSLSGASSANAVNTQEAKMGQTELYYVGMPPSKIAEFETLVKSGVEIKLFLTPIQNDYNDPNLDLYTNEDGSKMFEFDMNDYELTDSSFGVNSTFERYERDEFGRPLSFLPNGMPRDGNIDVLGVGGGKVPVEEWKAWADDWNSRNTPLENTRTNQ